MLRGLASESAVYGLGGVANQAVAVLLVPVYANVLGAAGTGVNAAVNTTLTLSTTLVGLALPQAFLRWFLRDATSDAERRQALGATLGLRLLSSVLGALVIAALMVPLTIALYGSSAHTPIFLVIPVVLLFDSIATIPLTFLRAVRRPRAYALVSFARALLASALIVLLVVVLRVGIVGVVLGSAFAAAISASIGLALLARNGLLRPLRRPDLWRPMLAFSLPLVPAALAGWTLNLSDRYILQAFTDERTVGIYAIGYTAGLVVNALAVQPFTVAWGASYWELSKRDDAARLVASVLTAFAVVASGAALLLAALGTDAIRLFLRPEFEPSRFVVPFSAFAYVLYGVFTILTTGLNLSSQTRRLPLLMGGAALLGVFLNVLLIPRIGYLGAAVSTTVSYAVLAVASGLVSQRFYPVPWDVRATVLTLGIGGALAAAALLGPDHVLWRTACVAAFPLLVVGLRVVRTQALALGWRALRSRGR